MTARRDSGMADPRGADGWALPTLGPRAMPVYRLVWSALFLVELVMTGLTLWRTKWDGPERLPLSRVGVNYTRDATRYLLVYEVPGMQGASGGNTAR